MRRTLYILVLFLLLPCTMRAQWSFDVPSIEAYIADHKDQKSLLLARATLEQANTLLHGYSRDANVTYKEINVELDKYTTAFWDKCVSQGDIVSTDALIITVNRSLLERLSEDGAAIYRSFSDLVLYATGAAACRASDLLVIIESINRSLDSMRRHLNSAYFETWRYIQVRIGYWKAQVYQAKTIPEIIEGAYGRWRVAGRLDY